MITDRIVQQILIIRDSGLCNLFDIRCVQREANDRQLYDLVLYLESKSNRDQYANFIMFGER